MASGSASIDAVVDVLPRCPYVLGELRTVDGSGQPTTTVLGTTGRLYYDQVTHDGWYTLSFETPVDLPLITATYALVFTRNGPALGDSTPVGWMISSEDDPYADGERLVGNTWVVYPDEDFFFKVFYEAPQETDVEEHVVVFDQSKAVQFFVSTDNTMELDMRFMVSFCIDGTGTMAESDPSNLRRSEAYLFAREVVRRGPESYIDVWTFDDSIHENTSDGPTRVRQIYAAALGTIYSIGDSSRLWAAAERAVGNLEPALAVEAIVRDDEIDRVLELMRQMNRIDYDELESVDPTYDASTGFAGISGHGKATDFVIQSYAETMGRHAMIMSDGFDTVGDTDPDDVATLANAVVGDGLTPVHAISMGASYWSEDLLSVGEDTGGLTCQVGVNLDRIRECFDYLLNDPDHTIFQGSYEDAVEFDELTYIESIEIGAIVPLTSTLTFEIAVTYDGATYGDWETMAVNSRNVLKRFIWGIKYRIRGWLGNLFGGNYYDIYGFDVSDVDGSSSTAGCRYTRYYLSDSYSYEYEEGGDYYYRDPDYPSPKVYSLRFWTVAPAVTYNFTELQSGGPISEYVLTSTVDLPRTARLRWGIVRGDSVDFADAELAVVNRRGVLANRLSEVYFTPDVARIGLDAVVQDQNRVLFKIFNEDGTVASWTTDDEVVVYSKGVEIDPVLTPYQLDGTNGYILFQDSRAFDDTVTLDVTTPGSAASTVGEICTGTNQRTYYAKNGPWAWDAEVTVLVNGIIRRDGYILYPAEGVVFFKRELDPTDLVTLEIVHSGMYRVAYELSSYDDDPVDPPDFGMMYSRTPETDTLFMAGLTSPPEASDVTLLPSGKSVDATNPDAAVLVPTTSRLVVDYEFYQAEGNAEGNSLIEWYYRRSGEEGYTHYAAYDGRNVMRTSETVANSPGGPFMEGDRWYVEVTPVDANSVGVAERSNIVLISDKMPPYVTSAYIAAEDDDDEEQITTTAAVDLEAIYEYVDPNLVGDQTASDASVIEWYKKGIGLPVYTSDSGDRVLSASYLKPGDVWFYVVTPYDGVNYGDRYQSDDVTITQEEEAS